jgi:peptidoglycan/xylan/chitin deacetylase (PgdA/CDA1 family)
MKNLVKKVARRAGIRRSDVAAVRMCSERNLLATFGPTTQSPQPRTTGRILCYHSIGQPVWGVNDISPGQFRRHIELALKAGYRFIAPAELASTGGGPKDLAITFDDGMKSALTAAAPILAEYDIPWSIFIVSEWADGRHDWGDDVILRWREIEKMAAAGVEIGSHSATHPDFGLLGRARFADELGRSRRTIEDRTGIRTTSFAIPMGQSDNWSPCATTAAHEAGYETIYAQAEQTRPAGTVARTFITRWDNDHVFRAALRGAFDRWEEWV